MPIEVIPIWEPRQVRKIIEADEGHFTDIKAIEARPAVMARNPRSKRRDARLWHRVQFGRLREVGISTPKYRKDSWEVEWQKRNGKLVWARNLLSKMPSAREWHWVDFHTLEDVGVQWRPAKPITGRYVDKCGYVNLTRRGMTSEEERLAIEFGLFRGARNIFVKEHQLVAVKKYRRTLTGMVVRHLNGIKSDNAPENILIGTSAENTMDHNTARLMAMYWRGKYEAVLRYTSDMVKSGEAEREVADYLANRGAG